MKRFFKDLAFGMGLLFTAYLVLGLAVGLVYGIVWLCINGYLVEVGVLVFLTVSYFIGHWCNNNRL
jgi:thiosulfate reductase cytochrome b subunit